MASTRTLFAARTDACDRLLATAAVAAAVAVVALAAAPASTAAPAAAAAPPKQGELVAGKSLGGIRLGMTPAQVRHAWGRKYGVCRSCPRRTWYFTDRPYQPQGAAVSFDGGRVEAIWTLWSPPGWRTKNGALRLGATESEVTAVLGPLLTVPCGSYSALVRTLGAATTAYYLFAGRLWGFGLMRATASPCR